MKEPSFLPSTNPRVQPSDFPFRHCVPLQIRFSDIDMLGHLNNNVYMTFMDSAKIAYFSEVKGEPITAIDLAMVVVNVNCDFLSQTFLNDKIEVWTRVTRIGERSLSLEQRIVDSETAEVKCIARTVMAGFDPATSTGAPIAPKWIEMIEAFEKHPLRKSS